MAMNKETKKWAKTVAIVGVVIVVGLWGMKNWKFVANNVINLAYKVFTGSDKNIDVLGSSSETTTGDDRKDVWGGN